MAELIDRQAVLGLPRRTLKNYFGEAIGEVICVADIKDLPSVTPKPKTGQWIENAPECQNIDPPYICSECGNMHLRKTNYCDQCGAKMVEPQESEG